MVRLVFYPLFTEEENLFSPLKALDHLSTSVLSALRQAESKRKQASADRSSNCVCIRGDSPSSCRRKRPLSEEESSRSAVDSTADDDSKFVVNCNVRGYKPEEISVKAIGDCVQVSAKHEEDSEDGSSYVKREFTQRFTLPEGVKAETVTCALSSSGVLAIEAPKPEVPSKKPRIIPITVESSKPIEAASEEANKEAEKQDEGAPEAASES